MVLLESFNTQDVQQTRRLNDILSWDLLNAKHVGYFSLYMKENIS